MHPIFFFFFFFFLSSSLQIPNAQSIPNNNPFTPKSSLLRYWNKHISNNLTKPSFLLSKASPLTAIQSATLTKLADQNNLSSHLTSFCSSANLFCFSESFPTSHTQNQDSFSTYSNRKFSNYGNYRFGGLSSFKNYSDDDNLPVDSFRQYSGSSSDHNDEFTNYAHQANIADDSFTSYGVSSTFGTSVFTKYNEDVNAPNLRFTEYNSLTNERKGSFIGYSEEANAGVQSFTTYGKNSNSVPNEFSNYGRNTNTMESRFMNYAEAANVANDTFNSYGDEGNVPSNNFANYGDGGNGAIETFKSYRDQANVGDDTFQSYVKNSNSEKASFVNYGGSFNEGSDLFKGYGTGSVNQRVGFKGYGLNTTFKDYSKTGISFGSYENESSTTNAKRDSLVNKWVEPGKFFRESMLKEGNVMPMPDIIDKMPRRSFLPRSILSKLPFSATELSRLFHVEVNSSMGRIINRTIQECERKPSEGETKMCVGSIEDMIDFAVSVLGHNVVVRSTENVMGSKKDVMIGSVKGINGGNVTQSVSCHQSWFPYLVYYCHSVPRVRVYEADILDVKSRVKINHGVAICHLDTSAWSPSHGAFVALGSSPGCIEVCHWIFENDMTWTIAD